MEDRVYNRWAVLQRELWNSEAVIKKLKKESEMEEKLFRVHCSHRFLFLFFTKLNNVQQSQTTHNKTNKKIKKMKSKERSSFPQFSP